MEEDSKISTKSTSITSAACCVSYYDLRCCVPFSSAIIIPNTPTILYLTAVL